MIAKGNVMQIFVDFMQIGHIDLLFDLSQWPTSYKYILELCQVDKTIAKGYLRPINVNCMQIGHLDLLSDLIYANI